MAERRTAFEPVTLEWAGGKFTIPPDQMMGAIASIENVEGATLAEIHGMMQTRRTVKMTVLARAFAALLRYAGAKVTDDECYVGMFKGNTDSANRSSDAMMTLLAIMVPPGVGDDDEVEKGDKQKK